MAADPDTAAVEWFPARLLQRDQAESPPPLAVVVLNQPLSLAPVLRVWNRAHLRVAADGGANRLFDTRETANLSFRELDIIIGDLDSLRPDTRQYFETERDGHATQVIHDTDQYSTDFTKAVKLVRGRHPGSDIVALGGLGGRVDQGVSQLHHLYLFDERRSDDAASGPYRIDWSSGADREEGNLAAPGRTFLLTTDSLSFLLRPGRHRIHVRGPPGSAGEPAEDVFAKHVGVLPMQGPSKISTLGLEWDVTDWPTEFGGQMSTSNHVLPETQVVEVQTNRAVIFTIALKEEWQGQ